MFGPRHEHRLGLILSEVAKVRQGGRVLDAAIGLGQLATRIEARGYRPVGIDTSLEATLHVCRTSRIPVVLGDLTRLPFRSGVFDAVTSGETLEHVDDDAAAAREIGRVVRRGGRAVVTVPALRILRSWRDDYYEHRRRYSRRELTDLFRGAGMEVTKAFFWGFPLGLTYDTLFLLPMNKRLARRAVSDDAALQAVARVGRSRLLVRLARALFAVDRLFSFIPFGPGLVMVARKPEE